MNDKDTILVTAKTTGMRGLTPTAMKVDVLAENVNVFLAQLDGMLQKTPEDVGKFKLIELTVTAEITAKGGLSLLGTGGEIAGTGGLTFKFTKTPA